MGLRLRSVSLVILYIFVGSHAQDDCTESSCLTSSDDMAMIQVQMQSQRARNATPMNTPQVMRVANATPMENRLLQPEEVSRSAAMNSTMTLEEQIVDLKSRLSRQRLKIGGQVQAKCDIECQRLCRLGNKIIDAATGEERNIEEEIDLDNIPQDLQGLIHNSGIVGTDPDGRGKIFKAAGAVYAATDAYQLWKIEAGGRMTGINAHCEAFDFVTPAKKMYNMMIQMTVHQKASVLLKILQEDQQLDRVLRNFIEQDLDKYMNPDSRSG